MLDPRLALRGGTIARAEGRSVELLHIEPGGLRRADRFELDADVTRLDVASDGAMALAGDRDRVWLWTAATGPQLLAARTGTRDHVAAGLVGAGGSLALVGQSGVLRGLGGDGTERLTADLRAPRSFYCHRFVDVPGDRIAIVGNDFSDPLDTVVTVGLGDLAAGGSVQAALAARRPVADRADRLIVGPGPAGHAVVWRDPGDEEPHDPDDDPEDVPDVWGLRGFYLRDLTTGALVERIAHAGPFPAGAPIVATDHVIAVEHAGRVDLHERGSGRVEPISGRAVALARDGARLVRLDERGQLEVVDLRDRRAP